MPPRSKTVFCSDMLLKTCILSGCDYLESLKGIGFKKALKLIKDQNGCIEEIVNSLKGEILNI